MSHQKDAASAGEVERIVNSRNDPVTGCDGYSIGPFSFGKDRKSIDILGQTRPA
jgi:hypothetical protein